ncbi:hypothetical protein SLEP1_g23508 [Rubroshorea leprosula]|uniref:Uncharacterized protein n=1 Tax=Rubroshorea leprosula TaxID=152421 RepID=A0AAV5JCL9_9ROSI|nr:hypothetical protein SLEP1_g23508 [Rubroshorea leprosula]
MTRQAPIILLSKPRGYLTKAYKYPQGPPQKGLPGVQVRTEEGLLVWCNYIGAVCGNRTESFLVALPSWFTLDQSELVPIVFPPVDQVEGGDENQPHASAHNSTSTANQDVVTAQLAAMQQQFAPQQNPQPVPPALAISESQGQSHITPAQQPIPDDVTRRLDSLEKLVAEHRGAPPPHHAVDSIPHPLNTNITLETYPVGFKIPQLETYDGTKDPDDHLHALYSCMQAQNASDALMCKIFPSTLRGNARTWYYSLPPRLISSYTDMASAFATKFSSRRLIRKTTSELMRVKQRDGESLKNYMSRFNDVVLEVSSFDQAVGIAAVISGLKHDRFRDSLIKHVATTFSEEKDEDGAEQRSDVDLPNESQKAELNTPATIYSSERNVNEYVQRAEQLRFVREQRSQPQGVRNPLNRQGVGYQQATPPLPPLARIIHMITGGLEAVVTPHNDPLVTSVIINNCEVQRVLVDTGSAPNIMYFHCFESLGLDPALLQKYDGPIYGFNNQPVPVEGVLTLHVAFGSGRTYVTPSVRCGFPVSPLYEVPNSYGNSNTVRKPGGGQTLLYHLKIVDNRPDDETRAAPIKDVEEVLIDDRDPSRKMQIGTRLNPKERAELIAFLRANNDVFAWTSADMPGIPKSVSQHKLSTNPLKKTSGPEAMSLRGVLVKKANGKWRMCIDYTNLNHACPKDCYPMPSIDRLVEAASGNERLSLLDAYSGRKAEDHLADLDETFNNLRKNRMRLNPAKCILGVEFGKFLGFMVSRRGIEVNPEKIRAIAEMEPPKSVKDIQRLTGRVAALHRFISKSVDKCLPFFKIMRSAAQKDESGKQKKFEWSQECQTAFDKLKSYLSSPPLLTKAIDGEILYLYLGISDEAISSVLQGFRGWRLLIGPEGYQSEHALKFNFDATNNMAEYEALLLGLQLALELKISAIQVYSDSQLVVNQINSICEVVDPVMVKYVALVAELKCKFQKFCLSKIPRAENEQADSLSKFASDSSLSSRSVFVEILDEPSFMKPRVMEISTNPDTPSWTDSIVSFLRDGIVPEDRQEAMKLRKKASRYTLVDGVLYKRSFSLPLLQCLNPYEAEYALREVHEGVCGSHVGARTLAHKVLRQGYYWPNMHKDATYFVKKCPKCQFFAHLTHQPAEELTNMVAPWPFSQWGLDLLGPFMKGVGGVTHLVVGVDYFSKWVEARPLSSLTSKKVEDFVFSSIICRYGIPNQIVADNGTQFNCSLFRDFCSSIKPRLEQHKAKWAEELNNVLWAYRTTSRTATGETLYHLAFGTEAVIPVEIGVPSLRVTHFDEGRNGQLLQENLDLLVEVREEARLRTLVYKQKLANFYNKRVRP